MFTTSVRLLALPLAALVLVGCSSDVDTSDAPGGDASRQPSQGGPGTAVPSAVEQEYATAISKGLQDDADTPFTPESAACFADSIAVAVGEDALTSAGDTALLEKAAQEFNLGAAGVTRAYAEAAHDACGEGLGEHFKTQLLDEIEGDAATTTCVEEAVTDDGMRDLIAGSVLEDGNNYLQNNPDSLGSAMVEAVFTCVTG